MERVYEENKEEKKKTSVNKRKGLMRREIKKKTNVGRGGIMRGR